MKKNLILKICSLAIILNTAHATNEVYKLCKNKNYGNDECHVYVNCTDKDILGLHSFGWEGQTDPIPVNGAIADQGEPQSDPMDPNGKAFISAEFSNETYLGFYGVVHSNKLSNTLFSDGSTGHYEDLSCNH